MTAKITLIGMWNYQKSVYNDDIFEGLTLPEDISKSDVVANIMLEGGEFEVLYADANMMKIAITNFGKKWARTFTKWVEALDIEYNPLENYRREERHLEEYNYQDDENGGHQIDIGDTTTTTDSEVRQSDANNSISAYNSDTMRDDTKTQTISKVNSGNVTNVQDHSESLTDSNHKAGESTRSTDSLVFGNIGVTTSQQMLQAELDVARFNVIQQITDLFITELTIPVYI